MSIPINPKITFLDGKPQYWVECPGCKTMGKIDQDQLCGRVSMVCSYCPYHETHNLTPLFDKEYS